MKIVPKIKLEVLTPGQLRFILFLTYFSLAVAILLTAFEDSLLYRTLPASGNPCPLGSTNPQGCVKQLGANSTWFFPLELTTLELYFSLSMQISRSPNQPLPRVSLSNIQARVDVAALGLDPAAAIDPATNSSTQEQFSLPTTFNLLCDINQVDCSVVALLDERDYIYIVDNQHHSFNVSVTFFDFSPKMSVDAYSTTFTFTYHNQIFRLIEICSRTIASVVTLVLLGLWIVILNKASEHKTKALLDWRKVLAFMSLDKSRVTSAPHRSATKPALNSSPGPSDSTAVAASGSSNSEAVADVTSTVKDSDSDIDSGVDDEEAESAAMIGIDGDEIVSLEQKWITVVLFALLLYQDPVFIPLMLRQIAILWALSGSFSMFALGVLMLFWLVFIQALGLSPSKYKKLRSWKGFCGFYAFKSIFFLVFEGVSLVSVFLSSEPTRNPAIVINIPSSLPFPSVFRTNVADILDYVSIGLIGFWILWFLRSMHKTSQSLDELPYLVSRHRQLSFRMYLFMTFLVIAYAIAVAITRGVAHHLYIDSHDSPFSTFVLFSTYIYMVAFIYAPVPAPTLDLPASSSVASRDVSGYNTPILSNRAVRLQQPLLAAATLSPSDNEQQSVRIAPSYGAVVDSRTRSDSEELTASGMLKSVAEFVNNQLSKMGIRVGNDESEARDPMFSFSFHTAKWCAKFSWESYYQPPDLAQYGFEVVASIHDVQTDTICFVGRRDSTIVVSFRGSVTLKNILTDLNMTRTPLPLPPPSVTERFQHLFIGDPMVHSGFWLAYQGVRHQVIATVAKVLGKKPAHFQLHDSPSASVSVDDLASRVPPASSDAVVAPIPSIPSESSSSINVTKPKSAVDADEDTATSSLFSCLPLSRKFSQSLTKPKSGRARRSSSFSSVFGTSGVLGSTSLTANQILLGNNIATRPQLSRDDTQKSEVASNPQAASIDGATDRHGSAAVVVNESDSSPANATNVQSSTTTAEIEIESASDADLDLPADLPSSASDSYQSPGTDRSPTPFTIYCTGHSLGGALSTLAAYDFATNFSTSDASIQNYTFGSPRIGNHAFANVLDAIVPLSFRIVNDRDVVTTFPKMLFLYKHASQEIVIDRFGNYIFNPSFVEKTILSGRNSLAAHQLGSYMAGLDNCALQHRNIVRRERQVQVAYEAFLRSTFQPQFPTV